MGEFPDPAIHGDPVPISFSVSASASSPSTSSSEPSSVQPSQAPVSTSSTRVMETSSEVETSAVATTSTSSTMSRAVEGTTAMVTSTSRSSPVVVTTSTVQSTSSRFQTSVAATPTTTSFTSMSSTQRTSSSSGFWTTSKSSTSLASTSTRPIMTPTPTSTFKPEAPTELVSANLHLSFGEIVGLVAFVTVMLGAVGWCVVLGPRRALHKVGIGKKRSWERAREEDEQSEDGEKPEDEERRASVGASSDWWSLRAPAGALASRMSSVTVGGPGMAGVGAGSRMAQGTSEDPSVVNPAPRDTSQSPEHETRRTVRSGWFAASMVRGASLLSLGSVLKPEPPVSRVGQGSAGRRFQELYRRERATEMGERASRVPYPAVKRPSRLGTIPAILVQDATLPSLSSASHVTGGYDADVERI